MALIAQLADDDSHGILGTDMFDFTITQNLPAIATIQARPVLTTPLAGVYSWVNDWDNWWRVWSELDAGFTRIRTSEQDNAMQTDEAFGNLQTYCETTGAKIMHTILGLPSGTRDMAAFTTDQMFFDNYNAQIDTVLNRRGPGGTYFDDYPPPDGTVAHPIMAVEFWNEPNNGTWFAGATWPPCPGFPDTDTKRHALADLYARCIMSAAAHIRAEPKWAGVQLVGAAEKCGIHITADNKSWEQLVFEHIESNGGVVADCIDAWSNHPYNIYDFPPDTEATVLGADTGSVINATAEIRTNLDAHGCSDKGIWLTEAGWHAAYAAGHGYAGAAFGGSLAPVTRLQQAAYVIRLYLIAMRIGIDVVHVMMDMDINEPYNGGFLSPVAHDGLPYTYNVNESWFAVQNYTTLLPNPVIRTVLAENADLSGYYAYELQPDAADPSGDSIIAMWNVAGSTTKVISLPIGNYTVYDMFGDTDVLVSNGSMTVPIGPYPVFVSGVGFIPPSSPWVMVY